MSDTEGTSSERAEKIKRGKVQPPQRLRAFLFWITVVLLLCAGGTGVVLLLIVWLGSSNACGGANPCSQSPADGLMVSLQSTQSALRATQDSLTKSVKSATSMPCDSIAKSEGPILSFLDLSKTGAPYQHLINLLAINSHNRCVLSPPGLIGGNNEWSFDRKYLLNVVMDQGDFIDIIDTISGNAPIKQLNVEQALMLPYYLTLDEANLSPDGRTLVFSVEWRFSASTSDRHSIFLTDLGGKYWNSLSDQQSDNDSYPRWSPDGKHIVFVSSSDGTPQIYVMDADGTNRRPLTNQYENADPAWSPDGTEIAFSSYRNGNSDIFVINSDGSNERRLTTNPFLDDQPDWSPDGKLIAFRTFRDQVYAIYSMNSDGSNQQRLTDDSEIPEFPHWFR